MAAVDVKTKFVVFQHGSFGGPGLDRDCYYAAGSDDFRAYIWKIPDSRELEQKREKIAYERWQNLQTDDRPPMIGTFGFSRQRYPAQRI